MTSEPQRSDVTDLGGGYRPIKPKTGSLSLCM